jgi:hypothetical protein
MSIILKALKKVQEQEAGQATGLPSDGASQHAPSPSRAAGAISAQPGSGAFSPAKMERGRSGANKIGTPPPVARQAFGFGPKALLGLLVVVGIAAGGWFASNLYRVNSRQAPEAMASESPVVAEAATRAVEETPSTSQSAAIEATASVSMSAPGASEENARVVVEAVRSEANVEPVLRAEARAEPAAMTAAAVVSPVETPGQAVPAMKEAEPEKRGRPEFKINAIAWKNKEPRAIVNMQSIYEGDTIEGATVLAIKRKIVVFEYEGETFEVRFGM